MHPVGKIIIGIILIVGSVWWVIQGSGRFLFRSGIQDFLTVVNGALPPIVFLIGVFVVWLELDEIRIERELATEEKKAKKGK